MVLQHKQEQDSNGDLLAPRPRLNHSRLGGCDTAKIVHRACITEQNSNIFT